MVLKILFQPQIKLNCRLMELMQMCILEYFIRVKSGISPSLYAVMISFLSFFQFVNFFFISFLSHTENLQHKYKT